MLRTFIGLEFPQEIKESFRRFLKDTPACAPGTVKWVEPENFHLTLQFLGPTPEEKIPALREALHAALAHASGFEMTLESLGAFPSWDKPNVVWMGLSRGAEELGALAGKIKTALQPFGFEPENRPFEAHATLGRVKNPHSRDWKMLKAALDQSRQVQFGHCRAKVLTWLESSLTPQGPVYKVLEKIPLS